MEKEEKAKGNVGLQIGVASLVVGIAAFISEQYRFWILFLYPIVLVVWLLWIWSKRLEDLDNRLISLEKEKDSNEKLLKTIKDITNVINNLKRK